MRIVAISNADPVDTFILNAVHERWPLVGLVKPVWSPRPGPRPSTPRKLPKNPARSLLARLRNRYYDAYFERCLARVSRDLFDAPTPPTLAVPSVDVPTWAMHDAENLERIRAWKADVLLVSGAPILRPELFHLAARAINVHLGVAPNYRGEHAQLVPLLERDWQHLGATLHHLDEGLDTGQLIARVYPALAPDDSEATLWAKSARLLAPTLVDYLERPSSPLPPDAELPANATGRNIRYADRRIHWDLRLALRRLTRSGPPLTLERIERYYTPTTPPA